MSTSSKVKKMLLPLLLLSMVLYLMPGVAGATASDKQADALIERLKASPDGQVAWEPEVIDSEETRVIQNPVYTLPDEGDLDQDTALRTAIETLYKMTDVTDDEIVDTYRITFYFNTTRDNGVRYWTIASMTRSISGQR